MVTEKVASTATNSQGAVPARVRKVPSSTDSADALVVLPWAVMTSAATTATRKITGGAATIMRRSRRSVYQAAATQPASKVSPVSTPICSQSETMIAGAKDATNN